jgi:hypothetical protein
MRIRRREGEMSTVTGAALWTSAALAIGLVLIAIFPGAVARAMTHLPGRSEHVLDAEETQAFNAAMALPDAAVQRPETLESIPEKYRDFVRSRPSESRIQFALMNDDLVFRIPRTEAPNVIHAGLSVFYFVISMPSLLMLLLGILGFQYVCFSGIQLQLTLIQDDPRSGTIISVLSAVLISLLLYELYLVNIILNSLVAKFGNQYILALRDRIVICKTLSVLHHTQMCPASTIQQWTPPLVKGQAGGQERIAAYFGKITLVLPTENDGRWIFAGLSVRYAARDPG